MVVFVALAVLIIILLSTALIQKCVRVEPKDMPWKRGRGDKGRLRLVVDAESSPLLCPTLGVHGEPHYMLFDTETAEVVTQVAAGQPPSLYTLIALSWQVLSREGNCLSEECHIVRQEGSIVAPDATEIHGITTEEMQRGEVPQVVLDRWIAAVEGCSVVVAHNLVFHLGVLEGQMTRLKRGYLPLGDKTLLCTMLWGERMGCKRGVMGARVYPSLVELFSYLHYGHLGASVRYRSKSLRDVRLLSACMRQYIRSANTLKVRGVYD